VPAAIIFDLGVGGRPEIRPGPDCGRRALLTATDDTVAEGSVGAGAGATVGKLGGGRPMKGGVGMAALRTPDGLIVGALMVTNSVGSIVDPRTGRPVAGALADDGRTLLDPFALVRRGAVPATAPLENTTIGVVVTNATLTKVQALKVAQMAQAGLARAIVPAYTPSDGDTLFVLATGGQNVSPNVSTIGGLAAEAVADAIIRSVTQATGLPGYPAVSDIR
jgi:L-aminopeptidase/D-esterase-like protein